MESGDESDYEPMSLEILEDNCEIRQYHPNINMKEASYNMPDRIK